MRNKTIYIATQYKISVYFAMRLRHNRIFKGNCMRTWKQSAVFAIITLALACTACPTDGDGGGKGGGDDDGVIPNALVSKWYLNADDEEPAFEITSANKFLIAGDTYDVSVSGSAVTLKYDDKAVGSFVYSIIDGKLVITDAADIGKFIKYLSPLEKKAPPPPPPPNDPLVGEWYSKATDILAFEITSDRKFIYQAIIYDMSVSRNTIELKFGGVSVGTFNYAVSGDQMLILSGTGTTGTAISLLSPLEKMTDKIAEPGQQMVFHFELISGGANNGTYRLRMANQWALKSAVIIPGVYEGKPVTEIGSTDDYYNGAFNGANIRAVYIPSSVKSIGGYTFSDCGSLENITFGAGSQLKTIGNGAFSGCGDLAGVAIPSGVTSIGDYAFYGCESLASVTIPAGVTAVGEYAFYGCESLAGITIPASVTAVGDYAFYGWTSSQTINVMGFTNEAAADDAWGENWRGGCEAVIVYPNHVHQWGEWEVTIPATCISEGKQTKTCALDPSHTETLTISINPNAHEWNEVPVIIPPTCTEEGEESIVCKLCGEQSKTITPSLGHDYGAWTVTSDPTCTTAGVNTRTCSHDLSHTETQSWGAINPDGHQWEWGSTATVTTDGVEGDICVHNSSHTKNTVFAYATGTPGLDYELIGNTNTWRVRKGTVSSGEVHIPAYHRQDAQSPYLPITEIGSASDSQFNGAFCNTGITTVTIPASVTEIGNYAFNDCISLTGITIPAGVTYIGEWTFWNCYNLTSVTIPSGVTEIGEGMFRECYNLASITIPVSVTSIGSGAFYNCTSLTGITIHAGVTSIGIGAFNNCGGLITVDAANPNYASENGILYNKAKTALIQAPEGVSNVTIPPSVTSVDDIAFQSCGNLKTVTFAAGSQLTTIGSNAFYGCSSLTGITLPATVTSIGSGAFAFCFSLTTITIPASVTTVGEYVFSYWSSSQTINVAGHTSEAAADAAWGTDWRGGCDATINYLGQ